MDNLSSPAPKVTLEAVIRDPYDLAVAVGARHGHAYLLVRIHPHASVRPLDLPKAASLQSPASHVRLVGGVSVESQADIRLAVMLRIVVAYNLLRPRADGREIRRLIGSVNEKGYTLVPLDLYIRDGHVKVTLALARGKKLHDKREALKERDARREMERAGRHDR